MISSPNERMEPINVRIYSTESLTRRNTGRQRSERRNLIGRWLFFMDGSKKRMKGGTSEFGIKVPPIPRRCLLLICNSGSIRRLRITSRRLEYKEPRTICDPAIEYAAEQECLGGFMGETAPGFVSPHPPRQHKFCWPTDCYYLSYHASIDQQIDAPY
jgi:hypothetical protein